MDLARLASRDRLASLGRTDSYPRTGLCAVASCQRNVTRVPSVAAKELLAPPHSKAVLANFKCSGRMVVVPVCTLVRLDMPLVASFG